MSLRANVQRRWHLGWKEVCCYTLKDGCMCETYIAGGGALADDKIRALVVMLDAEALRFRDGVEHRLLGLVCRANIG
eukprot:1120699-Prymnesium_polylepis.1